MKKKKKRVKFLIEFGDYINKMNSHGSRILLYIVWKDDNENIIKNLFWAWCEYRIRIFILSIGLNINI